MGDMNSPPRKGFLARPMPQWTSDGWVIAWFADVETSWLEVMVAGQTVRHAASGLRLPRMAEGDGLPAPRVVFRHHVAAPSPGQSFRAVIQTADRLVRSESGTWREPQEDGGRILITSDHQAMPNTAFAVEQMAMAGPFDAVFYAGDCVNVPDRASEWFDLPDGNSFFECLQGTARFRDGSGVIRSGGAIAQQSGLFTCVGNHEVMGRMPGRTLDEAFNEPVPRDVARAVLGPDGVGTDMSDNQGRVEDNSWSISTYQRVFGLDDLPGWYATRVGNIWLISLFVTRAWRPEEATIAPEERLSNSRYHDASSARDPLDRGYGSFPFVDIAAGSEQFQWLEQQLDSPQRRACRWTVVMMHEGPFGTGDNVMPPWSAPRAIAERDSAGACIGTRYEYDPRDNPLIRDVVPLLDAAKVDLVISGHNHVWNRYRSPGGVNYLETSNVGNTYGSTEVGLVRRVPPSPWNTGDYLATGSPPGARLQPASITSVPAVASNDGSVFSVLDSRSGEVVTWHASLHGPGARVVDLFRLDDGDD